MKEKHLFHLRNTEKQKASLFNFKTKSYEKNTCSLNENKLEFILQNFYDLFHVYL